MLDLPAESADEDHSAAELKYQRLKVRIHEKLVDSLDLSLLAHVTEQELSVEMKSLAAELVAEEVPKATWFCARDSKRSCSTKSSASARWNR